MIEIGIHCGIKAYYKNDMGRVIKMKIYLCAREHELFDAWKLLCGHNDFVIVTKQDIMSINAEALVSPANSFGFMSGGIDLHYRNYFGQIIEDNLRKKIAAEFNHELLVGQAASIKVFNPSQLVKYKYMIAAPTMRTPENISHTINAYLAAKAALIEALRIGVSSIVFPGLGTGVGGVLPEDCAKQMNAAINDVLVEKRIYSVPKDLYEEQDYMRNQIVSQKWFKVQMMES
jgi:O-acetyl-ADP-ribose deacetylase (regulator of RNase III)